MNTFTSIRNQSCPNPLCALHANFGAGNIISHGKCYPRFKCKQCGVTWVGHRDQPHYGLQSPKEILWQAIDLVGRGLSVRKIAQIIGVTPGTILRWKKRCVH